MDEPIKRDEKGRIVNDPGPGRPKKLEWLKMAISEMTGHHLERLEDIAKTGENKDSLAAIKLLWSYAYGNPAQVLTGADGTPLFTGLVPDLLKSMHKLSDK